MERIKEVFYPEDVEALPERVSLGHKDDLPVDLSKTYLKVRTTGNLKKVAYWLSYRYEWMLVKDDEGELCLLPRRKEC